MKRIFLVLFLVLTLSTAYAMNGDIGISSGLFGIGLDSETIFSDYFVYGRLLNFMYHTKSGFGITASPAVFKLNIVNKDNLLITFVNASLFYNFFRNIREYLILGPFASINAVNYNNPQFFEFRSGLIFSVRNLFFNSDPNTSLFDLELLNIEIGYKYNCISKSGFYAQLGIDFLGALILLGTGKEKEYQEYQKANPTY